MKEANQKDADRYATDKAQQNEWRGAFSDRERDFMSRREFRASLVAVVSFMSLALTAAVAVIR